MTQVTVNNLFLKHWQRQALRGLSGEFWTAEGPMRSGRSDRFTGLKCITIIFNLNRAMELRKYLATTAG